MPSVAKVILEITSDDTNDVAAYVRDCIERADIDWEINTAQLIDEDGVITDLLDEPDDESAEADDTEEGAEEEATEEEDTPEETASEDAISSQPTGKEF